MEGRTPPQNQLCQAYRHTFDQVYHAYLHWVYLCECGAGWPTPRFRERTPRVLSSICTLDAEPPHGRKAEPLTRVMVRPDYPNLDFVFCSVLHPVLDVNKSKAN